MTGNVVLLGFGIAGAGGLPVVAPVVSLVSFLLGAGIGGVLVKRVQHRHPALVARALGIEVSLIAAAAVLVAATTVLRQCLRIPRHRLDGISDGRS